MYRYKSIDFEKMEHNLDFVLNIDFEKRHFFFSIT